MDASTFVTDCGGDARSASEGIAVVGMAGRFPGARDVATFWANLCAGVESITTLDEADLDDAFDAATRRSSAYVKARGLLADVDRFDAAFFGINPREAELIDPQHRILLETAWEALEDAGLDPAATAARIGVIAGCSIGTYLLRHVMRDRATIEGFVSDYQVGSFPTLLGNGNDFLATRIAYKLDLRGPALTVQSACSTGLLAIAQAVQMLRSGQADVMLAGAAAISFPQERGYLHQAGGMVSADGHCRTFDAASSGTVFGAGAGVVVLKRLADARAAGDRIYAIVRGIGITNDGSAKVGFTAPSIVGQEGAIVAAHRDANVDPATIAYVECHGTGTPLGDPIEIAALARAFAGVNTSRCVLGSVKPNIGHLDIAAGMASFIKTTLAVHHGVVPPTLHFTALNPEIDFTGTPFYVDSNISAWPEATTSARRAGVSAFGVGGTNVHAVLESEPQAERIDVNPISNLFVVSGRDEAALARNAVRLGAYLPAAEGVGLSDVAWTLQAGRRAFAHRHAFVARSHQEAIAECDAIARGDVAGRVARKRPDVAFLFPGQGSQFVGMGRELYASTSVFAAALDRCAEIGAPLLGADLRSLIMPEVDDEAAQRRLTSTEIAQPAIFSISYALAEFWQSLGIEPTAMVGHSVGEFVAATIAGVFRLEDALAIVIERGRLMAACEPGAMLAVRLSESELQPYLAADVAIAAINSSVQSVVAGPYDAIAALEATLTARDIIARRVATSHAFHSAMMEPIRDELAAFIANTTLSAPTRPYVSTVTGTWIDADAATSVAYWVDHACRTVRFNDALATLANLGIGALLEVGPGTALATNARTIARERSMIVAASLVPGVRAGGEEAVLLEAVGALWESGHSVDWTALRGARVARRISLPAYAFEPTRHWLDVEVSRRTPHADPSEDKPVMELGSNPEPIRAASADAVQRDIVALLEELSGESIAPSDYALTFLELGFDSLFLGRFAQGVNTKFGVEIGFRALLSDYSSPLELAREVVARRPNLALVESSSASSTVDRTRAESPIAFTAPVPAQATTSTYEAVVREQLHAMQQLMRDQLAALGASGAAAPPERSTVAAIEPSAPARTTAAEPSRFDAFAIRGTVATELTSAQRAHIAALVARVTSRTPSSKASTQKYRKSLADPRVAAGFRSEWKEMVYPIVCDRAKGSRLWDVDGNEYIDILNGFGQTAFGHSPDFVVAAVSAQLTRGFAIGPQADLAGDIADRFCALTGNERMTFCNTGSEAVMAAMRVARTVTGRERIVVFNGAYHGQFDEVLVKGARTSTRSIPVAPGIPNGSVANVTVLPYATPESLAWVREHAAELAAVVVEPVQSRHPALQPRDFLHELRAITAASGTALVFDEVVTGFRVHPGGLQAIFDVRADLATYGKVVGGGMPVGILAGCARFMDALDGGMWNYGDDSVPEVSPTFFAGTFVRHPLTLAAIDAVLRHLETQGPALQRALTDRTSDLVSKLNAALASRGIRTRIETFGSMFYLNFIAEERLAGLLYYHMRERGIYVQEGFPCFLTTEHSADDVVAIVRAFEASLDELRSVGIFGRAPVREIDDVVEIELTEEQVEVYLAAQLGDEASCAFNESVTVRIAGPLDGSDFAKAFSQTIGRHEALRASYGATGETMRIAPRSDVHLAEVEMDGESATAGLASLVDFDARTPFDIAAGPLVRGTLVRFGATSHALVLTAHHLACDGWSMNVVLDELARSYAALRSGSNAALPEPLAYRRYAEDSRERGREKREAAERYWHGQFADPIVPLELPGDRPRGENRSFEGATRTARISAERYRAIKRTGARHGATLFTTLFGAFNLLIGRLASSSDVIVGVPSAGQAAYEGETLVGHCVNLLPIRTRWQPGSPFVDLLASAKRCVLDAYDHQTYTLGTLVRTLALPRERDRMPLTQIQFNLERLADGLVAGDVTFAISPNPKAFVNFDIFFNIVESAEGLRVDCDYKTALFDETTIDRWLEAYGTLLDAIVADATTSVDDLTAPLAIPTAAQSPASISREPQLVEHAAGNVVAAFESRVDERLENVAAVFDGRSITYLELDRRANQFASYLANRVGSGRLVAIALERSIEMLVVLLGTLKSGNAYLPLDPHHPADRLRFILDDSAAAVLVTDVAEPEFGIGIGSIIDVVRDAAEISACDSQRRPRSIEAAALAYTIYTSGSTGRPKGVEIEHRALMNLLASMATRPGLDRDDVFVAVTTLAFDIAALELFLPLIVGACVVISSNEDARDGSKLLALLDRSKATAMQATPATWRLLIEAGYRSGPGFRMLCGGEALRRDVADPLLVGDGTLWNMYGPTETTIWSSCARVRRDGPITVGVPIANTQFYVLDDADRPVPSGALGQLHIAGDGLARGYVGRAELTAKSFVPNPFGEGRLYRTGDTARARADGEFEILGRIDQQVKIRGYRVELGEIESALATSPELASSAVALCTEPSGEARLVAFYVPRNGAVIDTAAIAERLAVGLPAYMIPTGWVALEALPLSANGKLDRSALLVSDAAAVTAVANPPTTGDEPQSATEIALAAIWRDVLGRERIGIGDDLFAIGADSISLFKITARANRAGLPLVAKQLFAHRTLGAVARAMDKSSNANSNAGSSTMIARENAS